MSSLGADNTRGDPPIDVRRARETTTHCDSVFNISADLLLVLAAWPVLGVSVETQKLSGSYVLIIRGREMSTVLGHGATGAPGHSQQPRPSEQISYKKSIL